ncbi:hypothetical protein AVEN_252675-1 [Araneus ventricosus]|uniref:Uncharacterized protein n=1 Tax=Araneus ventricosus TaxID=182803 RepID=A0A4Y2P1G5_ARAVE|nr:hypothetical protein AVEN_266981-1 [Araneus ventricosus]GBN43886.1 hypothetical protein AVEN_252675-1 [Araneus ventricosus]
MLAHYLYVCGIQEVDGGEYDMTGLRITNLTKSKFVSVVNDQFAISENQLKAIIPYRIFEVDCKKDWFSGSGRKMSRIVNRTLDFKWKIYFLLLN